MQLVIYKSWDTHTLYMSLVESVLKKNYVLSSIKSIWVFALDQISCSKLKKAELN